MSEGKRTPGPYWSDPEWKSGTEIGAAIYAGQGHFPLHVATASPRRSEEEVAILVDLLNKGTRFEALLEAARDAFKGWEHGADVAGPMQRLRAAIAEAGGSDG